MSLRILIANEGVGDPGGVDTYLRAVVPALRARGHATAFLHYDAPALAAPPPAEPAFSVGREGLDAALARVADWRPDLCFVHNMQPLEVDAALVERWPVVKMMHGYFGTCVSGQKAWLWPSAAPCTKRFDALCLGYYFPRHCGQASVPQALRQYAWNRRQQGLFANYAAVVVASEHMRAEYERHGVVSDRLHRIPLFAPAPSRVAPRRDRPATPHVLFMGRMTNLKGGDLLIRAAALLARRDHPVALTLAGDGPVRPRWQTLAASLGVTARFTGWLDPSGCEALLAEASAIAIPSVWPEPFGLVGLEAAASGVPAVAFDVGGVREWLHDGESGLLAGPRPDPVRLAAAIDRIVFNDQLSDHLAVGARQVAAALTIDRHVDTLIDAVLVPAAARSHHA
jgi:glycosyltransferase involved in cell wall biosynthesis